MKYSVLLHVLTAMIFILFYAGYNCNSTGSPPTGLYFKLNNNTLLPGASVLIDDIGNQSQQNRSDAGSTLICDTTNVNTHCCRTDDGGTFGDWYFPNGTVISRGRNVLGTNTFARFAYTQQIRLGKIGNPEGPVGLYQCTVPDINGKNTSANINIVKDLPVTDDVMSTVVTGSTRNKMSATTSEAISDTATTSSDNMTSPNTSVLDTTTSDFMSGTISVSTMSPSSIETMRNKSTTAPATDIHNISTTNGPAVAGVLLTVVVITASATSVSIFLIFRRKAQSRKKNITCIPKDRDLSVMAGRTTKDKTMGLRIEMDTVKSSEANGSPGDHLILKKECAVPSSVQQHQPILVDDFSYYVTNMHKEREQLFELEFDSLHKSSGADCSVSQLPYNCKKNRFKNISPYDFNRVVLNTMPRVAGSDYINASYIDGYGRENIYVVAQGPKQNTVEDFWRMIWEKRIPTIVALTRVFEGKKKCEQYWPEKMETPFIPSPESSFEIKLGSTHQFPDCVVRNLEVNNGTEDSLQVTMFHYLAWPDHGVPENPMAMISFIKTVRKNHPYRMNEPLLVHCSAGVGRSGTFITLDYMLERIKMENSINIYEFMINLRMQRVMMVQTLAQYVFIHDALSEYLNCGETEIEASNFRIRLKSLNKHVESQSISGFEQQYQTLEWMKKTKPQLDDFDGCKYWNLSKNRYESIIPFDHTRVRLHASKMQNSDYINASFIQGYKKTKAYIATEGPLPHTVGSFWRMVWEQQVKCIVMLCSLEENDVEECHLYWPQDASSDEMYDDMMVTLVKQEEHSDYIIRTLTVSEINTKKCTTSEMEFTVTQFEYLKWPEDKAPQVTSSILEIANLVQKVQISTGNNVIVVMCNDGIGRSGCFLTIHAQIERMKAEGVVDFFQFIKSVRFQRAGLVSNKFQFKFCHEVLAAFLDGFDTYSNFKELI